MTNQPSVNVLGIRVDEPVIVVTNLLVAGVCFFAYYKLSQSKSGSKALNLLRQYFLLLGFATIWGGFITHGFFYLLSDAWRAPGWLTGMVAVVLMELAAIELVSGLLSTRMKSILTYSVFAEFIAVAIATVLTFHFRWTGIHSAFGLLVIVTPLSALAWKKRNDLTARFMLLGVLIFCMSGIVFSLRLSPHIWFNHVDLAHVFLALAVYFFYHGALLLQNRDALPITVNATIK